MKALDRRPLALEVHCTLQAWIHLAQAELPSDPLQTVGEHAAWLLNSERWL